MPQKPFLHSYLSRFTILLLLHDIYKATPWLFLDLIVPHSVYLYLSLSKQYIYNKWLSLSFFASNGSASVAVQEKRERVFIGKVKLCTRPLPLPYTRYKTHELPPPPLAFITLCFSLCTPRVRSLLMSFAFSFFLLLVYLSFSNRKAQKVVIVLMERERVHV